MSSREFPSTCGKTGIFDADGGKAGATIAASSRVYIPYCSSDGWMGDAAFAGYEFRGVRIVDAVLDDLISRHGLASSAGRLVFGGGSASSSLSTTPAAASAFVTSFLALLFLPAFWWHHVQQLERENV